jgi:hypothetical protein
VEATAQAARRIGAFSNQTALTTERLGQAAGGAVRDAGDAAVAYEDHRQISSGAAVGAKGLDGLTQDWNNTVKNADPNDPSVAAKFREEKLEPWLNNFRENFTTQRSQQWAEHFVDQTRQHFFAKTSADMSTLAGDAVVVNTAQTKNSLANAVYGDWSAVDHALDTWEHSFEGIKTSSPTLGVNQYGKLDKAKLEGAQQIVKAGLMGLAKANPDAADAVIASGKYSKFINPAEDNQISNYARLIRSAQERDARSAAHDQKLMDQGAAMDRSNEYLNKFINPETGEYSFPKNFRQTVLTDPVMQKYPAATRQLLSEYDQIQSGKGNTKLAQISQETTRQLIADMRSGKMAGNGAIYDALDQGKLTRTDFDFVMKQFDQARTPAGEQLSKDRADFVKRYAPSIDLGMELGIHSALGAQKMYQAERDMWRQEQDLRAQGKDPHDLYNPSSPNFFGRPDNLSKYRVTMDDAMKYQKEQNEAAKAPPAANNNAPPIIRSKAEFDKLPSGARFIGEDGKPYRKP